MTNKLHVVLSDFLLPADQIDAGALIKHYPTWAKFLARGQLSQQIVRPLLNHLSYLLTGQDSPLNWSELSANFDGLPQHHDTCYLRADPVHLLLQRDKLLILPSPEISLEEAQQFCMALSAHFADRGLQFIATHPERWYIRLTKQPEIHTTPLPHVIGQNMQQHWPEGADALFWHQLLNEVQMFLFSHSLNQQREEQHHLAINSVWPWGEGNAKLPQAQQFNCLSGDNWWINVLAKETRSTMNAWSHQQAFSVGTGRQLLLITGLANVLHQSGWEGWQAAVKQLEQNLFSILWRALAQGKLTEVQFDILGTKNNYQLLFKASDRWKIWRQERIMLSE